MARRRWVYASSCQSLAITSEALWVPWELWRSTALEEEGAGTDRPQMAALHGVPLCNVTLSFLLSYSDFASPEAVFAEGRGDPPLVPESQVTHLCLHSIP